jgi:hypothetical protein
MSIWAMVLMAGWVLALQAKLLQRTLMAAHLAGLPSLKLVQD